MTPVPWFDFPFNDFDQMRDDGLYIPRGCLLTIGLNPFTGRVFVKAQNNELTKLALKSIISEIDSVLNPKPVFYLIKGQKPLPIFEEVA